MELLGLLLGIIPVGKSYMSYNTITYLLFIHNFLTLQVCLHWLGLSSTTRWSSQVVITIHGLHRWITEMNQSITWNEFKLEITIICFHITDPDQPLCLRFWTHLFGNGIGTLKVIQLFGPPGSETSTRELWSLTGESSNNWHQGQISISSNSIFRVSIHCLQQFRINPLVLKRYFTT